MFVRRYKLNNSYTTYVVSEVEMYEKVGNYVPKREELKWEIGVAVMHVLHGKGVISSIAENCVTVEFSNSKHMGRNKRFWARIERNSTVGGFENLRLCY